MKKIICTLLAMTLLALCFAGCGHEEIHHHAHHFDAPLTPEQAGLFQSAVFRVYARQPDFSYAPMAEAVPDYHDGYLCITWEEKFLAGPDDVQVGFFPIAGSLGEYAIEAVLWDYDSMTSVPCTWRISFATGEMEVVGCFDAAGKGLNWKDYDQTEYKRSGKTPLWDEAGPMLPLSQWEATDTLYFSEDKLSNGVDLKLAAMEEGVEYFYNFEVTLTDGTSFCTEMMPLVHEDHELH